MTRSSPRPLHTHAACSRDRTNHIFAMSTARPLCAWDEQFSYFKQGRLGFGPKGLLFRYLMHRLRSWDVRTAHGPDTMLANSSYVRARIKRTYGAEAQVVYPPVNVDETTLCTDKDDYYVTAAFLAPYKRTDIVVDAFNAMPKRRLLVVGDGQQAQQLKARAGPNVTFTGYLPRAEYIQAVARAQALVFAGCEDFGIALAEAQAYGTPLIAFGRGGATDIVRPLGVTEADRRSSTPTVQCVIDAVDGSTSMPSKNAAACVSKECDAFG